ncbi:hypothetical protein AB0C22_17490 [Micromonospora sp. NPDC048894]|uniref:hypothetical protein n=1 Tax=unclassified Micromonospora TaxID=2617518 RepID=UPI0033F9ED5E
MARTGPWSWSWSALALGRALLLAVVLGRALVLAVVLGRAGRQWREPRQATVLVRA